MQEYIGYCLIPSNKGQRMMVIKAVSYTHLGFIRKIALEQYRSMGLDENDIGIDLDDLVQEGSIGLLHAIPFFDACLLYTSRCV